MPAIRVTPAAAKRTFSMITQARTAIRSFEPHIHSIMPAAGPQAIAKPDYARLVKRVGGSAVFYFPWMAGFLGFPVYMEYLINGTMGGRYWW